MAVHNERLSLMWGPVADVAAGTGGSWGIRVPGPTGAKYRIESAFLFPDLAITANGTNYSVYTLANATTSTTIGSRSYIATNSVALTPEAITVAAAAAEVTAGDILSWAKVETASGLAGRPRPIVNLIRVA